MLPRLSNWSLRLERRSAHAIVVALVVGMLAVSTGRAALAASSTASNAESIELLCKMTRTRDGYAFDTMVRFKEAPPQAVDIRSPERNRWAPLPNPTVTASEIFAETGTITTGTTSIRINRATGQAKFSMPSIGDSTGRCERLTGLGRMPIASQSQSKS